MPLKPFERKRNPRHMMAFSVAEQWLQPKFSKICCLLTSRSISDDSGNLELIAGSCYLPKENEQKPEGEDAHFISMLHGVIGVADGVSDWARLGVDSGEYARTLMQKCELSVLRQQYFSVNPMRVLKEAYSETEVHRASTACIIALKDKFLNAVNIGDSGFTVIKNECVVYKSPVQQHYFNCPYQLGNNSHSYRPRSAQVLEVPIVEGNVVVAATDGLFDNLFNNKILETVIHGTRDGMEPRNLVSELANCAQDCSYETDCPTPFSEVLAGDKHSGGKIDDITVIVACIIMSDESLPEKKIGMNHYQSKELRTRKHSL